MMSQFGLFDFSDRLVALSAFGDPLERLSQVVNFEIFRPSLESGFNFSDGSQGGRPPWDDSIQVRQKSWSTEKKVKLWPIKSQPLQKKDSKESWEPCHKMA